MSLEELQNRAHRDSQLYILLPVVLAPRLSCTSSLPCHNPVEHLGPVHTSDRDGIVHPVVLAPLPLCTTSLPRHNPWLHLYPGRTSRLVCTVRPCGPALPRAYTTSPPRWDFEGLRQHLACRQVCIRHPDIPDSPPSVAI